MASRGHRVYATARRLDDLAGLAERGCRTLSLDVTDEQSMRSAVAAVEEAEGAVGVLVNNAGYSQSGAIEMLDLDDVRRQFETNVFGLIRMCQLVLPGMRRQRSGRIVNVSSMGGKLTFPGGGAYHATKHAVEAISDALRFEVKGFGVDVVVIEPGLIKTRFGDTARATVGEGRRRRRCVRDVQRGGGGRDRRRLRGSTLALGRRARDGGSDDREGGDREAAPHPLSGNAVGLAVHRSARRADRSHVGRSRRHAVPAPEVAAGQVTSSQPASASTG